MVRQETALDVVAGVVVDVVRLHPRPDAIAADVRVRAQTDARTRVEMGVELESSAVAAVDVDAEREADVGELAGRGDLVAELHGVGIERDGGPRRGEVPTRLEVVEALGADGVEVMREGRVVLSLKEVIARRLARGNAGGAVDGRVRAEVVTRAE